LYTFSAGIRASVIAVGSSVGYRHVMRKLHQQSSESGRQHTELPVAVRTLAGPIATGLLFGGLCVLAGVVTFWSLDLLPQPRHAAPRTAQNKEIVEPARVLSPVRVPAALPPKPVVAIGPNLDFPPPAAIPKPKKLPDVLPAGPELPRPPGPDAATQLRAKEIITLRAPPDSIIDIRFSPGKGDVPCFFVLHKSADGKTNTIQRMALNGRLSGQLTIPLAGAATQRIFETSDTAQRVLVEAAAGKFTVYDFETRTTLWEQHDVYEGIPDRVGPPVAAFFGKPNVIMVVDQKGTVDTWDLATQRRLRTGAPLGNSTGAVVACRSAVGTIVVIGRQVFFFPEVSADVPTIAKLPTGAVPIAVDADPLGKQIAVVYQLPNRQPKYCVDVVRFDLIEPIMRCQLADSFGVPNRIGWIGLDTLGITTSDRATVFIDTERGIPFGYAKGATTIPFVNELSLFQYTIPNSANLQTTNLVRVEVPFSNHRALVNDGKPKPIYLAPRADGLAR
jgi:hypothetical protein